MRKQLIFTVILVVLTQMSFGQSRVANYSTGRPGTKEFEQFGFWMEGRKVTTINYAYGKDWKSMSLKFLGTTFAEGQKAFQVEFPNKLVLTIRPMQEKILVTGNKGGYRKVFSWWYEGPHEGIGTFCEQCAADQHEAMKLMMSSYFK